MADILEDLLVERPVAGGDMLARHDGRVVLVSGAIPGERVRAEVMDRKRGTVRARTIAVLAPSPDRREPPSDPACGGLAYAHIAYGRQCTLKREVIIDAFRRIGKMTLPSSPVVTASPEAGYRWRARLHVRERRAGFFREGSHAICDAGPSHQLLPSTTGAIARTLGALGPHADACEALIVVENAEATERVVHLEPRDRHHVDLSSVRLPDGVTGVTARAGERVTVIGSAHVSDTAGQLLMGRTDVPPETTWTRGPESFFQANRYLTGPLVSCVLDGAAGRRSSGTAEQRNGRARVADLYAGVGLFAVVCAAAGAEVLAVENDRASAADLTANARPWPVRFTMLQAPVEDATAALRSQRPNVVIVDPPRVGLSRGALSTIVAASAPRVIYVSCDPATLARDAAQLVAAGYDLGHIEAFDLFPNTAHVETVAIFDR